MGAKEGGRELFDDPSYVNVDKPRPQAAANGNVNRDAFDMSMCLFKCFCGLFFKINVLVLFVFSCFEGNCIHN